MKIYQPDDKTRVNQWRDCIDIAVKLAFNLNHNEQHIKVDEFDRIDFESLRNNISAGEVGNNVELWKNFFPEGLSKYPVRAKQSSKLTDQKLMNEGLKILHHTEKELAKMIGDMSLNYLNKETYIYRD